jgi:hypothetical protein
MLLTSLVGSAIVSVIMYSRLIHCKLAKRITLGESFSILLSSGLVRDYIRLLSEAGEKPTTFDRIVSRLHSLLVWCLGAGILTVALGAIGG